MSACGLLVALAIVFWCYRAATRCRACGALLAPADMGKACGSCRPRPFDPWDQL